MLVEHTVLIEEHQAGYATGYTDNYIRVYIEDSDYVLEPGSFVTVRLEELHEDGCIAKVTGGK